MEKVKFVLADAANRPDSRPFATLSITPRGRNSYCHLELGEHVKWEDFRRLVSLNYWMEWDQNANPPRVCLSRRAFADGLAAPRNGQQAEFGQFLPAVLQKDPAGWRVVEYLQTADDLRLTFAHASRTTDGTDDLVQVEINFMHQLICSADFG